MHLEYIYVVLIVYHILHQIHVVDVTVTGTRTMINLLVSEVVDDPIVSVNCYCNRWPYLGIEFIGGDPLIINVPEENYSDFFFLRDNITVSNYSTF